ncbi:sensor histidine kinase [Cohnella mopanensis]|uniref:sensor histidine kinase n=1 Tax=Cohnella mopanensis TaxID=2911966 RepID=UPI001EF956A9|nr:sensor histidine kinase [Cohnella mopanensis]
MPRYWKNKWEKIKFRLEQTTLQKRLVIAYILIMLLPSLLISMYIFRGLTGNTVQELQKNNEYALEIEQINIENNMETMKRAAQRAIVDQKVIDYLMQPSLMSVPDLIDLDRFSLQNIVRIQFNNPNIELIRIFMSNSSTNEMSPILLYESRIQNASWYSHVMEADQADVWVFSRSTKELFKSRSEEQEDNRPRISLYRELQYPQGTHVGILQVDMFLTNFFPNTFSALQDEQSQLVVIDRKGNFIRNPASGFLDRFGLTDTLLKQQIASIEPAKMNKGSFEFRAGGVPFLAVYSYIEPLDSYMIKVASLKPVYDGINETRNRIILANVVLLAILTVSTYYLNSFILKKLHVLTDSMKKVRQGDFGFDINIRGGGEVGDLAHHFRKMLRKINELIADAVNKQAAAKEAELATLKNQIDSHFLYNTLENIKMMAEINDQRNISDALTSLGSMMRYNMRWTSEYVRLKDEMTHIGHYINIANIRFDDRMKLVTNVPDKYMNQELLKMSLQPVVENSVKHGLGDGDLTIVIVAEIEDDAMLISITDDGVGMSLHQVQQLNERIMRANGTVASGEEHGYTGNGNGIGLVNVHSRIQMHFGKEYGLKVESEKASYTRVTIRIPHFILDGGNSSYENATNRR